MLLMILGILAITVSITYLVWLFFPSVVRGYDKVARRQIDKTAIVLEDMLLLPIKREKLTIIYVVSSFIAAGTAAILTKSFVVMVIGFILGAVFPMLIVKFLSEANRRKFLLQLEDTLNLLSSCLKAGLTLPQAFETVVEEMPRPTKDEFALILQQMKMGIPLEGALNRLRQRIRDEDVDIVVISILVARDTGGNITEVFSSLTNMIREKRKIAKRVKVLTVQPRLQSLLIAAMPFLFIPFVLNQNPHYFDIFFKDKIGQAILAYAVFSQVIGLLLMQLLGKVEV